VFYQCIQSAALNEELERRHVSVFTTEIWASNAGVYEVRTVFEKTCATTQKYVKSHVFWILKKNVKKRKKNVCIVSQAT